MKRSPRLLFRAGLALLSLLALAVAPAYAGTAAATTIRIASPDLSAGSKHAGGGLVDVLYAQRLLEKEFAKDGIRVEWLFFKGAGPVINEAFANRQLDFAFLGDLPPIIGRAGGLDTRVLLASSRGINGYLAAVPGSGIRSLADLKGKRVGLLRGTADELAFTAALGSQGLSTRDVRLVNLDFNAVNAALAARRIDATWGPSRLFALRDRGLVTLPVGSAQLGGAGSLQGAFIGTGAFLQAHPEIAQRVVNVVVKAAHWLSQEQNRQAQIALSAAQSGYPASVFEQQLRGGDLRFVYSPLLDTFYLDNLRQKVALAKDRALIRRSFDIGPWIEPRFLDTALRELRLAGYWKPTDRYQWSR